MTAHTIIEELKSKGIKLEPKGENLRCKAPKWAWTPELQERVRAAKPEILAFLKVQSANPYSALHFAQSQKPMVKAKVRAQERIEASYNADICWHCKGELVCNCATCEFGLPWEWWQPGQCGCCRGTGYLCWGDSIQ